MIEEESNKPENLEEAIEKIQALEAEIYANRGQIQWVINTMDAFLQKFTVKENPKILMPDD